MSRNLNAWFRTTVYVRLALGAVALAIMLFSAVVFSDGRLLSVAAVFGLLLFMYWDLRVIRSWRQPRVVPPSDAGRFHLAAVPGHGDDVWLQLIALWRIDVGIAGTQLIGAILLWSLAPLHDPFADAWLGGTLASFPGLMAGLALQRAHSDQWGRTRKAIRLTYVVCAALLTLVGAPLGVFVLKAVGRGM